MPFIFSDHKNQKLKITLSRQEIASIYYHDIFDYPMTLKELTKWSAGKKVDVNNLSEEIAGSQIKTSEGLLYIKGREKITIKRLMRHSASTKKIEIAKNAVKLIKKIPTVKAVCITGALAMKNADENSDIDLMVITKKGALWATRLAVYTLIKLYGIPTRKPREKHEKDKLCLNIWLDETSLVWPKKERNVFIAHELAQIVPLVNKEKAYEDLLAKNSWIKDYWPNAVKAILKRKTKKNESFLNLCIYGLFYLLEPLARTVQTWYMKDKVTNEVVTSSKAIFHPTKLSDTIVSSFEHRMK